MLTGLVGIEGIPNELDKEKLLMENFTASGFQSRTIYKNIHFLKPGHYGKVSRNGFELSQYWKPLDKPKVNFKKGEEYFEAYYETFNRAVRDRLALTNRWGMALSGGLDSAGVTAMASKYFKERNETMEAFCFVPNY